MLSAPCKCTIDLLTSIIDHSKTVDHIYVNYVNQSYISGVIISDLSDHFGTFIYASKKNKHYNAKKIHRIRDMGNFNLESCFSKN